MVDLDKARFWEQVRLATKLVASWPLWKQNILVQSGKPTVDVPRIPIKYQNTGEPNMKLYDTLSYCWQNHTLPKEKYDRYTACIPIGYFRFFFSHNAGCKTAEIKVIIVHPDGSELKIIHQLYGSTGPAPDWTCWKCGKWNQALTEAHAAMELANNRTKKELDIIRENAAKLEAEKHQMELKKFEDLFA